MAVTMIHGIATKVGDYRSRPFPGVFVLILTILALAAGCAGHLTAAQAQTLSPGGVSAEITAPPPLPPAVSQDRSTREFDLFGATTFAYGGFPTGQQGASANSIVAVGDTVSVRMFGAVQQDIVQSVDPQGNIFLPDIGAVKVKGTRASDLTQTLQSQIGRSYSGEVQVYATIVNARSMGVFVTGFVVRPGRYPGAPEDSVIDFLARAGGIVKSSGSFREITVIRDQRPLLQVDLYEFLVKGYLPPLILQEGDTIVVGAQNGAAKADGMVRTRAIFEFEGKTMTGRELMDLSRPLPGVTHALVAGVRGGTPFSEYVPIGRFSSYILQDQDTVTFDQDATVQTVTVKLEGTFEGPSTYVVDKGTSLLGLLDYVAINGKFANPKAIYLKRTSVADLQSRALTDSLDRLQRSLLTAVVQTDGEAALRSTEANMVLQFIARARTIKPDGLVVVADAQGNVRDLRLEDGDTVFIPERSTVVNISGEVLIPQTVVWESSFGAQDYIKVAGGPSERADLENIIVRHQNGVVDFGANPSVGPGDEVIVPPAVTFKGFQFFKDVMQVVFQAAGVVKIFE
ncbi:polysaccharide biosynthesis/export family protein [Zavarzinia sp.]|uniref:polysaccharide biosynthesis/export family protein n=1 Tax=Zavarzinia sp. TaxID=2027920 RepID=UPI00356536F9